MRLKLLFIAAIPLLISFDQKPLPPTNSANTEQYNAMVEMAQTKEYLEPTDAFAAKGFKNGATVFVGSSTFTNWGDLESIFAQYNAVNRGIGGSAINHIIAHSENLIFGNNPRLIVLYIGDNDVYSMSVDDFKSYLDCFITNFRHRFATSDLIILSIKPSPGRPDKYHLYRQINQMYEKYAQLDDKIHYIDIWSPLSIESSQYFYDTLHLNESGYQVVVDLLMPVLKELFKESR